MFFHCPGTSDGVGPVGENAAVLLQPVTAGGPAAESVAASLAGRGARAASGPDAVPDSLSVPTLASPGLASSTAGCSRGPSFEPQLAASMSAPGRSIDSGDLGRRIIGPR